MFRFRETVRGARLAVAAAVLIGGPSGGLLGGPPHGTAWEQPAVPDDAQGVVEDLYLLVESLDGSESELRGSKQVTVALTSDVLFDLDKADLTGEARRRLRELADQIRAEGAGGVIKVAGHTDSSAGVSYNQKLSERRAEAVREQLAELLAGQGFTFEAKGYGEKRPRFANDSKEHRARNRRVEISYDVRK